MEDCRGTVKAPPCGPALGGVCFEPEGSRLESRWVHVGHGKGGYERMQTFNYVGEGAGQYHKEQEKKFNLAGKADQICKGLVAFLFVGALVYWASAFVVGRLRRHGQKEEERHALARNAVSSALPYDCSANSTNWEESWSAEQKGWCCARYSLGCPLGGAGGPSTLAPFDCNEGFSNWEKAWNSNQKAWCCDHANRGCKKFNCQDGYPTWEKGFSDEKKAWCCDHEKVACPKQVLVAAGPLDPGGKALPARPLSTLGASTTGAPVAETAKTTSTEEFHNCQKDYVTWQASWIETKRAWCCKHQRVGCLPLPPLPSRRESNRTEAPAAGSTPTPAEAASSPSSSPGPRLAAEEASSPIPTLSLPVEAAASYIGFTCKAGDDVTSWPLPKRTWCCTQMQVGCAATSLAAAAAAATTASLEVASPSKKPSEASYDCVADRVFFKVAWPMEKKVWCCRKYGVGCHVAAASPEEEEERRTSTRRGGATAPEGRDATAHSPRGKEARPVWRR